MKLRVNLVVLFLMNFADRTRSTRAPAGMDWVDAVDDHEYATPGRQRSGQQLRQVQDADVASAADPVFTNTRDAKIVYEASHGDEIHHRDSDGGREGNPNEGTTRYSRRVAYVRIDPKQPESLLKSGLGPDGSEVLSRKKKDRMTQAIIPLLIAYKMKFIALIPIMVGGLSLLTSTTALAGFFFALFAAVLGLKAH